MHREDDEIYETVEVELQKKRERGLGLSIVGKKSGPGVFISEVVKGGAADLDGRLIQVRKCFKQLCESEHFKKTDSLLFSPFFYIAGMTKIIHKDNNISFS